MSESYYESGPQSVSQIVISLCTGQNKAPCISLRLVGYCFVDSFYVLSHLFISPKKASFTQVSWILLDDASAIKLVSLIFQISKALKRDSSTQLIPETCP